MYSKIGQIKWILVSQMLKIGQKMANGQLLFPALVCSTVESVSYPGHLRVEAGKKKKVV